MSTEETTKYPNIPIKHWWILRTQFKQSIPTKVTPGYIATVLGMQEKSAKANIFPSLVKCKIIDSDGKPLERATSWRDDKDYAEVCKEIKNEIYPRELLEAIPGPNPDLEIVKRWFANNLGIGMDAQRKLAAVYCLLQKADVSEAVITISSKKSSIKSKKPATASKKSQKVKTPEIISQQKVIDNPSIHVDIQIHISPDSSKDQIDHIFKNLAKYYKR